MKNIGYIVLGIAVLFYLYFTIRIQIKIIKTISLNKNQKFLNSIFLWLIPFLWGIIIKALLKQDFSGTITKEQRKTNDSHFYESDQGWLANN